MCEHQEYYKYFSKKFKIENQQEVLDGKNSLYNAIQKYSKSFTSTYAITALKHHYERNSIIKSWKNVHSLKDLDFTTNASSINIKKEENSKLSQPIQVETKIDDKFQHLSINKVHSSQKFQQHIKSEKNTLTKSL